MSNTYKMLKKIPKPTLSRIRALMRKVQVNKLDTPISGKKQIFTVEKEGQIIGHLFGKTYKEAWMPTIRVVSIYSDPTEHDDTILLYLIENYNKLKIN